MSKFEWMELETLSNEIAHAQSRLDAARSTKNLGLVQLLEREIADTAKRRAQVLADITNGLGVSHSARSTPQLMTAPAHRPEQASLEQQQPVEQAQPKIVAIVGSDEIAPSADMKEGVASMWDKLTSADLERIKRGLVTRRSEILARHAEELKALETEQAEIDTIEKTIAAFTQKFKLTTSAQVVPLDGERSPAQAG